jgi:hypothetical protein
MAPIDARAGTPRLTVSRQTLEKLVPELLATERPAFALASKVTLAEGDEYLIAQAEVGATPPAAWRTPGRHQTPFILRSGERWRAPAAWQAWLQSQGLLQHAIGLAAFTSEGDALGWVHDGQWRCIRTFNWPGPGMERLSYPAAQAAGEIPERDSRLAGALSAPVLARLRSLSFAVVGVSRLGSLVAHTLARWGVRRIALIDPDVVEPHNADAGEFFPHLDDAAPKVKAVARAIGRLLPADRRVQAWAEPLHAPLAFAAARAADVIVSCVDDDGARLLAAVLAASHLRVHLDLGTHVRADAAGRRSAGADIRLVLPEDPPWCLACYGGFAGAEALRRLAGFDVSPAPPWSALRAGSLRTVNQIAAHLGLRLIERLASGDVARSTWLRYEDAPMPSLREIVPQRAWGCPLCSQYCGIGDAICLERDLRLRRLARALAGAQDPAWPSR